jgi:hypothetical protein
MACIGQSRDERNLGMKKWQPIETIPKEGIFLVCNSERGIDYCYDMTIAVAWWVDDENMSTYYSDEYGFLPYLDGPATHWMHIPDAPEE